MSRALQRPCYLMDGSDDDAGFSRIGRRRTRRGFCRPVTSPRYNGSLCNLGSVVESEKRSAETRLSRNVEWYSNETRGSAVDNELRPLPVLNPTTNKAVGTLTIPGPNPASTLQTVELPPLKDDQIHVRVRNFSNDAAIRTFIGSPVENHQMDLPLVPLGAPMSSSSLARFSSPNRPIGAYACVNYKSPSFDRALRDTTPDEVDINEPMQLRNWFEIVSQRLTVKGLFMFDHMDEVPETMEKLIAGAAEGRIKVDIEDVVPATIEQVPNVWLRMYEGIREAEGLWSLYCIVPTWKEPIGWTSPGFSSSASAARVPSSQS
ncbi:uncharacterized protein B0T15DRAFT_515081 [Chaetomium strumarium]|uniref:Uncharacterized protein n=1 Tax=Chaetomium strumarium TaxID=1170767 RepID=A0AAJ0GKY3_9PEZI|nr:hypothetical protein B0T15DRAFT_515081 [Chaetomium strumarium]